MMTLDELFIKYVEDIRFEVAETTIASKTYIYNKHFKCELGNRDIEKITDTEIKEVRKDMMLVKQLDERYVNKCIGVLSQVFVFAVDHELTKNNPIKKIKKVVRQKASKIPDAVWTACTFKKFITVIQEIDDIILFSLYFFLGLRKGEAIARKWSDIDFHNRTIAITSSAVNLPGKGLVVTSTKNHETRVIYLNDSLYDMLLNRYLELKASVGYIDKYYIIGNKNKPISRSGVQRLWEKYLLLSNSPVIKLHTLRASHGTMLAELTDDIKSISERLGHSDVKVTLKYYIRSSDNKQKQLASLLETAWCEENSEHSFDKIKRKFQKMLLKEVQTERYKLEDVGKLLELYNYLGSAS